MERGRERKQRSREDGSVVWVIFPVYVLPITIQGTMPPASPMDLSKQPRQHWNFYQEAMFSQSSR